MEVQKTGALIAAARKEKGLTQEQLARQLHISHTTVSKWERGLGFPEVSLLEPLGAALDLTLSELFRGEKGGQIDAEDTVSQAVRAAREELLEKQRDTRSFVLTLLACMLIIISLLLWGIWQAQAKPYDIDIRGTYQTEMTEIGPGAYQWEGLQIQLTVQNIHGENWFELYIRSCLVDTGYWEKLEPNLYRLYGEYCRLTVELHKDGSFYLMLPGMEAVIPMVKVSEIPVSQGNQELWSEHLQEYRAYLAPPEK